MSEVYYKGLQKELQLDTHTLDKVNISTTRAPARCLTTAQLTHRSHPADFPGSGRPGGHAHAPPDHAAGEEESVCGRQAEEQQQLPHLQHRGHPGQPGECREEEIRRKTSQNIVIL